MELWDRETEKNFFLDTLKSFASPEQLFYKLEDTYYAYIPKGFSAKGQVLQSRNSLIGHYTEKWCQKLLAPIAHKLGLHAVQGVICEDIALTRQSPADVAFCTTPVAEQEAKNVKLIFEIKMSIVSNYRYDVQTRTISYYGDYTTHQGNPSLLRSDSMLKAIGKAINIRVSGDKASGIPLIVIGNSPITESYIEKVDFLKESGVIQGFWSLNPYPSESKSFLKRTPKKGFLTFENYEELEKVCISLLNTPFFYFSSMKTKKELGRIIAIASKESTDIERAEKFLALLRE
ncbi:MAG TPA: hypothetical protein PLW34_00595 [Termitinemataceae bacterium]|nr:hypothetical protein [Termitinemataceae bacterium]HOM22290.1 hypothetical protein [Termitinemataceae bacterium]HPP99288.1 hypothetical protein [Termitinemataceae bacterium]